MNKRIYLSGPIAGCTDDEANSWRDVFAGMCSLHAIDTLNPMRRDYRNADRIALRNEIVELDKHDIDCSDALVVYFSKPSVGTAMEVLYAWQQHKPVVTIVPPDSVTLLSPWLVYHSTTIISAPTHNEMFDSTISWISTNVNTKR